MSAAAFQLGRHDEAETAMRRELALVEAARGPAAPQLSTPLHNLAATLERQGGDAQRAEVAALLRRALAIAEQHAGAGSAEAGDVLNSLAALASCQRHNAEAESLYQRAPAIRVALWAAAPVAAYPA